MTRTLARRIAAVEAANAPPVRPYSGRVEVGMNETIAEATARYVGQHGKPSRNVSLYALPSKPRTPEERAEWERRFADRQLGLIATHRHQRLAIEADAKPEAASPFPVGIGHPIPPRFHVPVRWQRN